MKDNPLVSICIPTYNSATTLIKTIKSILNQTYPNLEIIVLDNASTDNTKKLLSSFIENQDIKYYQNEKTITAEYNFSKSVELAEGDYIAIFHADDLYKSDMVQKQVDAFLKNPDLGAVFTLADVINEDDEKFDKLDLPSDLPDKDAYDFDEIFISTLKNMNFLICPSAMVQGELYKELMPFDYEHFKTSSDLDMWFRIMEKQPIAILRENLMDYRLTETQGTYQVKYLSTQKPDFFKVIDYYLSVKLNTMNIPSNALEKYECMNKGNNMLIGANHLIKGEVDDAKYLIKETLTLKLIFKTIRYGQSFRLTLAGIAILLSIYLHYWKHFRKILQWYLYGRGLKVY